LNLIKVILIILFICLKDLIKVIINFIKTEKKNSSMIYKVLKKYGYLN